MNVKIKLAPGVEKPTYATEGSAGMDLRANEVKSIPPFSRRIVKTGVFIELPMGYEAQIRPRSGNAIKRGIGVLNAPGTIDCDYRGDIGVILYNSSNTPIFINKGEKIAQMVVAQYEKVKWDEVDELSETVRGAGGFGSTGKN